MTIALATAFPEVSPIAMGCMGFGGAWDNTPFESGHVAQMHRALDACLEAGINVFDHADIYTRGKAEQVFGEVLKQRPGLRQQLIIQSKCAIRFADELGPGRYDWSRDWIMASVEGSLKRLGIEQLDILLLHRPDPLMVPEEIAAVVDTLASSGKVRHFGVSNMHVHQLDFLRQYLPRPLLVNQLEMSLGNLDWLNEGVNAGSSAGQFHHFAPGMLEYARRHHIQLQAWGCLAKGIYSGAELAGQPPAVVQAANLVAQLAAAYEVSREAIVLAWLMRHPAGIQPVIGTTQAARITACAGAQRVFLSREHWYQLYVAARGERLP